MCTAITFQSSETQTFFARTMDFSHDIQPHLYSIPRGYRWYNTAADNYIQDTYSFMGIGQQAENLLGFFDGVNETGLAAGALYFAGYADYQTTITSNSVLPMASFDFLHYILGNCSSIPDLLAKLSQIEIIGMPDPVTRSVAPLHWIAADRSGNCIVLEQTAKKWEVFYNPLGVFANSPDFRWHMTNLNNYTEVSPQQTEASSWGKIQLKPFGQAGGTSDLPGGYTSPARFVRTAYLKTHIPTPENAKAAVMSAFHVLKSVSIPKGAVVTARNTEDYTKYTACISLQTGDYFFQTYDNQQITKAAFPQLMGADTSLVDLGTINRPAVFQRMGT